ncbi:MAG: hypothetical protein ACLVES_04440 [Faecalibacterium prausnitzii]
MPQPAATAGTNRPGQSHRAATAAPSAQSRQTLSTVSVPKLRVSTPSAAPAAPTAKQSSAKPSVSPSPKGISAPYSTAQPPASPSRNALPCRRAGRTAARARSAPFTRFFPSVSCIVRKDTCMKKSPLSGGDLLQYHAVLFCFPRLLRIL